MNIIIILGIVAFLGAVSYMLYTKNKAESKDIKPNNNTGGESAPTSSTDNNTPGWSS